MKALFPLVLWLVMAILLAAPADGVPIEAMQGIENGLTRTVQTFTCGSETITLSISTDRDERSSRFGLTFVFVRIPLGAALPLVDAIRRSAPQKKLFGQLVQPADCVITNGGFWAFDSAGRETPLGLIVSSGKNISRRVPWTSGGFLCIEGAQLSVLPVRSFFDSNHCFHALQTKPLLVEHGKVAVHERLNDLFNRMAIGLDRKQQIIIAGAFAPTGSAASLAEFATYLTHDNDHGGPATEVAIALDGGPGAQLVIPSLGMHFGADVETYVPAIVRFRARGRDRD